MAPNIGRQRGFTLIIGLMMLIVITVLVLSAVRTGLTNSRVVGNMQFRDEATYAAQAAIERTLGATTFVSNPAAVAASPVSVDINGDGVIDYTVQMTPQPSCLAYKVLTVSELAVAGTIPPENTACLEGYGAAGSGASTFVAGGAAAKPSLCANTHWRITAQATSPLQSSVVQVVQGVALRVDTLYATTYCGS